MSGGEPPTTLTGRRTAPVRELLARLVAGEIIVTAGYRGATGFNVARRRGLITTTRCGAAARVDRRRRDRPDEAFPWRHDLTAKGRAAAEEMA